MDFGEAVLGITNDSTVTFDDHTAFIVEITLIVLSLSLLFLLLFTTIFVKYHGWCKKFKSRGGCYVSFSILGSASVIISYTTLIQNWPNVGAFWGVCAFYWGFAIYVSPFICYTWWMVCLLLKQTPEFPYLKYESGSLQINWVLGHTLERDKWFVWKRIPLFIIPPFVALIVVLLRSDMDIYSSFLLSADFMDPYNQFLMVVLFLVTSQFVYRYIHRIKWSQSASFSDDKDKKMKTVIRSSSFVMTRAILSLIYGISCELGLWFLTLHRGTPDPGYEYIALPYVLTTVTFHYVMSYANIIMVVYPLIRKLCVNRRPSKESGTDEPKITSESDDDVRVVVN
eukprot:TRINITY_DN1216_c0_g1_i3.p1 TRINITY_DN1216_c0_g1~~TRINITY_DN1216_c0_g1_i3.p1  ORF type:complete len:340 (+),score=26.53 TRINITY_DN1216_c0_g1_i3:62-1081(+)